MRPAPPRETATWEFIGYLAFLKPFFWLDDGLNRVIVAKYTSNVLLCVTVTTPLLHQKRPQFTLERLAGGVSLLGSILSASTCLARTLSARRREQELTDLLSR